MIMRKVVVNYLKGIHLRIAADLVAICKQHKANVVFSGANSIKAEGDSVLSMLMLNAQRGTELTIKAEGKNAEKVVNDLVRYFGNGSGI